MSSYCLKCKKKYRNNVNPRVSKNDNGGIIILSKCAIHDGKKQRFF